MEWNQTYGGEEIDVANSLVATSDGGYVIAGGTSSFDAGNGDCLLIKTDEYGVIPEFSSWTPLLFVFCIVAVVVGVYKRRLSASSTEVWGQGA
jgi:hypothetical protein